MQLLRLGKPTKRTASTLGLGLILLSILPGCTKSRRKLLKPVKPVEMAHTDYHATQKGVTVAAQLLDEQAYKHVLRKNKLSRFDRQRKAIKLSVTNDSLVPILLNKESVDLELTPYTTMTKSISSHAMWQGIGISVGITMLGGGLINLGRSSLICGDIVAGPLLSITGVALLSACTFVSHKRSAHVGEVDGHNKLVLKQMMLEEPVIITPKETQTRMLFVKKRNYMPEFEVTLTNVEDHKQQLYFIVELEPQYR